MCETHEEELRRLQILSDNAFAAFRIANELARLEEAIQHLKIFHERCGPGDEGEFGHLAFKLAQCLQARYERGKDPQEISNAIANAEAAIKALPTDLTDKEKCVLRAERSCLLSKCLVSQGLSQDCQKPESLETANTVVNEAVTALEALGMAGGEGYIMALRQSACCKQLLWDRHEQSVEDLEASLSLTFRVLDWSNQHASDDYRAQILGVLAARLLRAHRYHLETGKCLTRGAVPHKSGGTDLGERAIQVLTEADNLDTKRQLTGLDNIISVVEYLQMLPKEHQRPLLGRLSFLLRRNVERLKNVIQASLKRDITAHAEKYFGLSRYAAAAAIEAGEDAFSALYVLEQGRDITGSAAFDIQTNSLTSSAPLDVEIERHEQLKRKLIRAIEEEAPYQERLDAVASLRAFEQSATWTQHVTPHSVTQLASDGPIVVISTTNIRSDAFVITNLGVRSIWLPKLIEEEVSKVSWGIQWRLAQEAYPDPEKLQKKIRLRLYQMLELLWRNAIKPILDDLDFKRREDDVSRWPRVCWIPAGLLALYPVGVAGLGLDKLGNAFNRVISTYAPSIKSLLASCSRAKASRTQKAESGISAAVLAMVKTKGKVPVDVWERPEEAPEPKKWEPLDFSKEEARIVKSHISSTSVRFHPKTAEVIKTLRKGFSIIHFSCHGYVDYISPSESMLLFKYWMKDPLSVKRISKADIRSNLAVISACFTANSGYEGLQDEPSHMAASLFTAGFRIVVGSLWSVGQSYTRAFFEEFYRYLAIHAENGLTTRVVAEAVHVAIVKVAESTKSEGNDHLGNPTHWAPFICFGI